MENLIRRLNRIPGELGDVNESIRSPQVNKCTKIGYSTYPTALVSPS